MKKLQLSHPNLNLTQKIKTLKMAIKVLSMVLSFFLFHDLSFGEKIASNKKSQETEISPSKQNIPSLEEVKANVLSINRNIN